MPLEFAFRTEDLRSMCEKQEVASEEYGILVADSLRQQLADLRAVDSIADLPPTTSILLSDDKSHLVLEASPELSLKILPNHSRVPQREGFVDWSKVHRILLEKL